MDQQELLDRAGERGVNRLVLGIVRLLFLPFFLIWFRLDRIGREHVPKDGPVIFAANHRSFLDPFVIAACTPAAVLLRREEGAVPEEPAADAGS